MKFDGDIRVHTDNRHADLYNDLKNMVFNEMHEVFFLCGCLGYRKHVSTPLGKYKDQRFWSKTITPDEYACFYAMILNENSMDFASTRDDKRVLARMEEFANAGVEILIKEFLCDYTTGNNEIPRMDASACRELPKNLLHFISSQL
jgi:hypothetical protein